MVKYDSNVIPNQNTVTGALDETYGILHAPNVAIGYNASTADNVSNSIAIGTNATVEGSHSIAIGWNAFSAGSPSIAIGSSCNSSGIESTIIGYNCTSKTYASIVGHRCTADMCGHVFGYMCNAGMSSVSIGVTCESGASSVAIGSSCKACEGQSRLGPSVAIGSNVQSNSSCSVAIGSRIATELPNSIAIGSNVSIVAGDGTLTEGQSIAIGTSAVSGPNSISIGDTASASGEISIAIGSYASAINSSIAIGRYACTSNTMFGIAIGAFASADGINSTALGGGAVVSGNNSSAIGYGADTTEDNTIQLGSATTLSKISARVAITTTSDERDKTDIVTIDNGATEFLNKIHAIRYKFNDRKLYIDEENLSDEDKANRAKYGICSYNKEEHAAGTKKGQRIRVGVSAQETQQALKEVFGDSSYANLVDDNFFDLEEIPEGVENQLSVNYSAFIPFIIKAIQEISDRLDKLESVEG